MNRTTLLFAIVCMIIASCSWAQDKSQDLVTWDALKASFGGESRSAGISKIMFPSPWPVPYTCHSSIDETTAMIAMMRVGLEDLESCSNVLVMSSTTSTANGEIVAVSATRPDGQQGVWLVDTLERVVTQELIVAASDVNNLSITNVTTGELMTSQMINDTAEAIETEEHVQAYDLALDPGEVDQAGAWDRIKSKWNQLNTCEQGMLVTGIITCSTVGGWYAVGCGAGFYLSASAWC